MHSLISLFIGLSFLVVDPELITTKSVDVNKSTITWEGRKVTGSHEGTIKIQSGNLDYEGDVLTGGEFVIDMTTITCTDLNEGGAKKLVGHLSSDDFFGVATYPTAKFIITKVVSRGMPGDYKVTGDLTIKDITKSTSFNTKISDNVAQAEIQIDRSDYNIKYGSGSFFDNLGDKTIYDEFDLNINLVTE
jgi:polyisoprenoid-binding protein YceI